MKTTQKPEICSYLIFDESYHECGVANKKRTQWEAQGIIGRVAKGFKRLSNIPEEDLERLTKKLRNLVKSLVKNHGLKEKGTYRIGCFHEMCPLGCTHGQIEAMIKRIEKEKANRDKWR